MEANGTPAASTGLAGPADSRTGTEPAGHPNTRTCIGPGISAAATAGIRLGRTWRTSASSFVDTARTRARANTRAAANSGALTHPGDACTATC